MEGVASAFFFFVAENVMAIEPKCLTTVCFGLCINHCKLGWTGFGSKHTQGMSAFRRGIECLEEAGVAGIPVWALLSGLGFRAYWGIFK